MNERGQKAKHTVARHLQALRLVRSRRIIRTIPTGTPLPLLLSYKRYAVVASGLLGRSRLRNVAWPWQARPVSPEADPSVRVSRGRESNPTALR